MSETRIVAGLDAITGEVTERELTAEEIAEFEMAKNEALIADSTTLPSPE